MNFRKDVKLVTSSAHACGCLHEHVCDCGRKQLCCRPECSRLVVGTCERCAYDVFTQKRVFGIGRKI